MFKKKRSEQLPSAFSGRNSEKFSRVSPEWAIRQSHIHETFHPEMWRPADTPEVQLFVPLKHDRKPEDDPFASKNGVNFQGQTVKLPGK